MANAWISHKSGLSSSLFLCLNFASFVQHFFLHLKDFWLDYLDWFIWDSTDFAEWTGTLDTVCWDMPFNQYWMQTCCFSTISKDLSLNRSGLGNLLQALQIYCGRLHVEWTIRVVHLPSRITNNGLWNNNIAVHLAAVTNFKHLPKMIWLHDWAKEQK